MEKCENINELLQILEKYGIVDSSKEYINNPNNPQIFAHGTSGDINDIKSILKNGLNTYNPINPVTGGILSTNIIVDPSDLYNDYLSITRSTPTINGLCNTIISVMPKHIDDIYLGKVIDYDKKGCNCCVLDGLKNRCLPPEFILGVFTLNPKTGKFIFNLNPKFYALNKSNYQNLTNSLRSLIENSNDDRLKQFLTFSKDSIYYKAAHNQEVYSLLEDLNQLNPYLKEIVEFCKTKEYEDKIKEKSNSKSR